MNYFYIVFHEFLTCLSINVYCLPARLICRSQCSQTQKAIEWYQNVKLSPNDMDSWLLHFMGVFCHVGNNQPVCSFIQWLVYCGETALLGGLSSWIIQGQMSTCQCSLLPETFIYISHHFKWTQNCKLWHFCNFIFSLAFSHLKGALVMLFAQLLHD